MDKNPFYGKLVRFVYDESDNENADGVRGHLEAIADKVLSSSFYDKYTKRALDVALSLGGIVALSPVLFGISLAIKIDDPGPVLFTQKRLGKNKEFFPLHKFRSMKMSTPHDVPTHMLENPDSYITKVGAFLRAHSLDELPQIFDILVGNMSVVGPRPALWNQELLCALRDEYGANDVHPGLTGWAQINGRDELELTEKARLDGEYIKKESFLFDLKCFVGTITKIGSDESNVEGGTGSKRHYTDGKTDDELRGKLGFSSVPRVDENKKCRVLIVGADSYIGESFRSYASEHFNNNFELSVVGTMNGEWKDFDFSPYDTVFCVAGIAHNEVGNADCKTKELYYSVNSDLPLEIAKKAKAEGVSRFFFMSSAIVYGKNKNITVESVPSPENFYGDSKLQADVALRSIADKDFSVVCIRPPMIYGKGSKGNYPLLSKLASVSPIFPQYKNSRSMLYVENLCELLCSLMLSDFDDSEAVLLPQNEDYVCTSELVKKIADTKGRKIKMSKLLSPAVSVAKKIPGKIGALANKAFGDSIIEKSVSNIDGIRYRAVGFDESVKRTETEAQFDDVQDVTVVILTKNEEINLPDAIESVKGFAKRVLVVDSISDDRTVEIAKEMGADVLVHPFESHAKQFNWALDNGDITTKWTFRLDADERLTPALCTELASLMKEHDADDVNGVVMEAWLYFLGRRIEHGCHNKRKLMLFKTGMARSEIRNVDEHTILSQGTSVYANERFIHYDFKGMADWVNKLNWYADKEVQDYFDYINGSAQSIDNDAVISDTRAKKFGLYYKAPPFIRPQLLFLYYYIAKLGFLDGKEGLVYNYMYHSWYRTLVDSKILEQKKKEAGK